MRNQTLFIANLTEEFINFFLFLDMEPTFKQGTYLFYFSLFILDPFQDQNVSLIYPLKKLLYSVFKITANEGKWRKITSGKSF